MKQIIRRAHLDVYVLIRNDIWHENERKYKILGVYTDEELVIADMELAEKALPSCDMDGWLGYHTMPANTLNALDVVDKGRAYADSMNRYTEV